MTDTPTGYPLILACEVVTETEASDTFVAYALYREEDAQALAWLLWALSVSAGGEE